GERGSPPRHLTVFSSRRTRLSAQARAGGGPQPLLAGLRHACGLFVSRTVEPCPVVPGKAGPACATACSTPGAGPPSRGTLILHFAANTQGRAEPSTAPARMAYPRGPRSRKPLNETIE